MYAIIVTDGVALEYPPELYETHARARLEAERWAWILSGTGWLEVDNPFEGRRRVADRDVRLVLVTLEREAKGELWVAHSTGSSSAMRPIAVKAPSTPRSTWSSATVLIRWRTDLQDRSSTERMFPAGSLNQAIVGPLPRAIPFSSCSNPSYRSKVTPAAVSSSTAASTSSTGKLRTV